MRKSFYIPLKDYENNFLIILLKEKPNKIQLETMNLHNFNKAICEIYEFNKTLDISIEQLYLNRNKLDVTLNKLLDFCLHIDSEQYGFNFPNASEVTHENMKKEYRYQGEYKIDEPIINIQEVDNAGEMVLKTNRSGNRKSMSNISASQGNRKGKFSYYLAVLSNFDFNYFSQRV